MYIKIIYTEEEKEQALSLAASIIEKTPSVDYVAIWSQKTYYGGAGDIKSEDKTYPAPFLKDEIVLWIGKKEDGSMGWTPYIKESHADRHKNRRG